MSPNKSFSILFYKCWGLKPLVPGQIPWQLHTISLLEAFFPCFWLQLWWFYSLSDEFNSLSCLSYDAIFPNDRLLTFSCILMTASEADRYHFLPVANRMMCPPSCLQIVHETCINMSTWWNKSVTIQRTLSFHSWSCLAPPWPKNKVV